MSESKHTPGPWSWEAGIIPPDGPGRYADIYILDEDREPIMIAEFNDNIPEGRANALLMTAAPELLAACQAYAAAYDGGTGTIHVNAQVRAAIALATNHAAMRVNSNGER